MNRVEFSYEVNSEVLFTADEVRNLMKCSREHYDYKCKAAGCQGGFLYGLNNRFVVFPEEDGPDEQNDTPAKLSWHEVDTLCKILEGPSADPELAGAVRRMLSSMSDESRRLNQL
jgi:hypothetical protein